VLKTQGFSLGCTPLALQAGGSYPSACKADGIEPRVPTLGIRAGNPPDSPSPKAGLKGRRIRFSKPGARQRNIKTCAFGLRRRWEIRTASLMPRMSSGKCREKKLQ
jgi:hypothetical protein